MTRKYFLTLLFILTITLLFSKENVLLITTNNENYNQLNNMLEFEGENINYDVDIILVNDEDNNFSGSKNYLNNELLIPPLFSLYIDNNPDKEPSIAGFSRAYLPPLSITKILLKGLDLEDRISREFPLYLTSLIRQPELQKLYLEYDIPAVILTGEIPIEVVTETLKTNLTPDNLSSHYFIENIRGNIYYINELNILITILVTLTVIVIFTGIHSKRTGFHLRHNLKYLPTIPLKILMIFIFYFISGLVITYVEDISRVEEFILEFPKTIFVIKTLIMFFLYGITFHIIKDASFSKSPYFYSVISLHLSILLFFVSILFYMPLGFYFIWQIVITMIFMSSKNTEFHRVLVLLNTLVPVYFFYNFISSDFSFFVRLFSQTSYVGNISLALISSPFIFLHESLFRFIHRKEVKITHTSDIIKSLLILTVTIALISIILELK